MRSAFLALCLAAWLPAPVSAEDQQFAFALPEAEGRISLGVFDGGGKLVRTLYEAAREKDFKIGLNGYLGSWDGKNDAGEALPAGKYWIRGWLVADTVKAEGVAFHFNDWITDDSSPEISGVGAVVPGEKDSLVIFGVHPARGENGHANETLWRFSEAEGLSVAAELPRKSSFVAGASDYAVINDRLTEKPMLYPLAAPDKPFVARQTQGMIDCGAFWQGAFYAKMANGESLSAFDLSFAELPSQDLPLPSGVTGLDANAAALIAWGKGQVWLRSAGDFAPAPFKELPPSFDISAGPDKSLWVAGRLGEDLVVRQHDFDGELLREMKIPAEAPEVRIFASKTSLSFYLLLHTENWARQTLRGYRPAGETQAPNGEASRPVDWEIFLDKTIENSRRFGLYDGKLVANAGDISQQEQRKIDLPDDTLTGKKSSITVRAMTLASGLWLATTEGLPLVRLTDTATFDRFVVAPGEAADSVRLFAGNGVVVAEYLLSGLGGMAAIDAGEVDLP